MKQETVTISKKEYAALKSMTNIDKGLLKDIAKGIDDILHGRIKEV